MNKIYNRWLKMGIYAVLGAVGGYAYYYFIGCKSGTCAITNNPLISTAYGAMIGAVWAFPSKTKSKEAGNHE